MTGLIIAKRVLVAYSIVHMFAVCEQGSPQWEDMIYVELSARISGQRVKEDTNPSEHLTKTRLPKLSACLCHFQP